MIMKKIMSGNSMKCLCLVIGLALLVLTLTACGKSEFGVTDNTGKLMTITAEKASRDAFFLVGSLDVADEEQIVITSNLTKGSVRVEIVTTAEEQSIDKLPDINGEAIITANLENGTSVSGTVDAGSYLLRATCLEKATGTIQIEVKPAAIEAAEAPVSTHKVEVADQSVTTLKDNNGDEYKMIIPKLVVDGKEADSC